MKNRKEISDLIQTLEALKQGCCATDISINLYTDALRWVLDEDECVAP